ncbi:MAG TPA: FHA domain-containing protein [Aggregatilineales bacterium]|nr:FHA domain-containing protein [Aggregatilineales bacterium]
MQPQTLGNLFTLYVQLRQVGRSMDDVVNLLQDAAQQLPQDERRRLGELVLEWEGSHGQPAPASARPGGPKSSPPRTPTPFASQRVPVPLPFGTKPFDPSKITNFIRPGEPTVQCPHCGQPNVRGCTICRSCGKPFQLKVAVQTRQLADEVANKVLISSAYFSQNSTLLIAIRNVKGVLEAHPRDKLLIGRDIPPDQRQAYVDLAPYNAAALGVSRAHAEIRFSRNTLTLIDLNSNNGTFINGVRLHPNEVRVLHHGDELRFGMLATKIAFKHGTSG